MQRTLAFGFALLGWFAVICQFYLMMDVSTEAPAEVVIRFLSYFTILTNTLVAVYFTIVSFNTERFKPGKLTAITLYITVVGLVYQVVLRSVWDPQGLQRIVDELLHSVIPVCTIVYWLLYEKKGSVTLRQIPAWLIYPLCYFIFVLVRGSISNFYPYPFINADTLGYSGVAVNAIIIFVMFVFLAWLLVALGKKITPDNQNS